MSSDEKVLDFPRVEVTSEENARRVMVEATRLARLAPGEWRLWIDRSDLHALLAELEGAGLVARVRDPEDRRRNVVTLTAAGKAVLRRLDLRVDAAQTALLEPLSAGERREVVRLLGRVVSHRP